MHQDMLVASLLKRAFIRKATWVDHFSNSHRSVYEVNRLTTFSKMREILLS